jgi:hypothetical protein
VLDDLWFDNQRCLAILAAPPYQVLVVGESPMQDSRVADVLSETTLRFGTGWPILPGSLSASGRFSHRALQLPELDTVDVVLLADVRIQHRWPRTWLGS